MNRLRTVIGSFVRQRVLFPRSGAIAAVWKVPVIAYVLHRSELRSPIVSGVFQNELAHQSTAHGARFVIDGIVNTGPQS